MKLKETMDSYNIASLTGLYDGVVRMQEHCERMDELCDAIKSNIEIARENGYANVNHERAEAIITEYRAKLTDAREEFTELAESVKRFAQKIDASWSSWS